MDDRLARLESELGSLRDSLARLQSRVAAVEDALADRAAPAARRVEGPASLPGVASGPAADRAAAGSPATPAARDAESEESPVLLGARLTGGILLVIAGGYLLRALTEAGTLPQAVGVVIGLGYALAWSAVGHVLARRARPHSAAANGIATALLAFPLVWEATVRFQFLSPWSGAILLLGLAVVLLHMAMSHELTSVAWITILGVGGTSLASMFGTRTFEPYVLTLLLVGLVAGVWGRRHWLVLPWMAYGFADLGCLLLVLGSLGERPVTEPSLAVPILTATFLGFLGIFVWQTWRTGELALDEPIQGTAATILGFGGALLVATGDLPAAAPGLAALGLLLGVGGYVLLLTSLQWTRAHRWPFLLYSSLALATVAMSVVVLFQEPGWVFAGLAVVLAGVGAWLDRTSPGLHAAMSLLLAAFTSGLAGMVQPSLTGGIDLAELQMAPAALATVAAAVLCALLPLKTHGPVWPSWLPRLGRAAVILVAVLGIDVLLLQRLLPVIVGGMDEGTGAAAAAALRTGVAAALIVLLAVLSRWHQMQPASWLIYPLLAVAGLKLVLVDFPQGRAITMAIALLLYGGALILAPRWSSLRDRSGEEPTAP